MFKNREEAGHLLAKEIKKIIKDKKNWLILAIPKGGVPVAYEICKETKIPIKLLISKKIGHPFDEELAIGAMVENIYFIEEEFHNNEIIERTKKKISDYKKKFKDFLVEDLKGKNIILVDDGAATGLTLLAALKYLKEKSVKKIIVALPCAHREALLKISSLVDNLVVLLVSDNYEFAISLCYEDFHQLSDKEVLNYLENCQI